MATRGFRLAALAAGAGFVLFLGGAAHADHLPGIGAADKATGGGLEAAAIGELGDTEHGPIVDQLLDLPALDVGVDAQGRIVMDLPGLKLVSRAKGGAASKPGEGAKGLPKTGADAAAFGTLGLAALGAGGVLYRRLRVTLG